MSVAPDDRGFLYGDALFETVAVRDGRVRWLNRHLKRLRRSGAALGFPDSILRTALDKLEHMPTRADGLWRVTVSRPGSEVPFGGSGSVMMRRRPLPVRVPPRLTTMRGWYWPGDPLAEHKTTSWLRWAEARRRAMYEGFDDALLLSARGRLGEATAAAALVVVDGVWCVPPLRSLLRSVTRAGVVAEAEARGRLLLVRDLGERELARATEVVLLSAGVGAVAAASLNGRVLRDEAATEIAGWLTECT
ncbi:MAG: aminotransferase class IV [Myxococcota bacterium]